MGDVVEPADDHRPQVRTGLPGLQQRGEVGVAEDRVGDLDLPARLGARVDEVALGTERHAVAGDELLADGVERRVGHLREALGEVVEQHPRTLGQHR